MGVSHFHSQEDGTVSAKVLVEGKWWKWINFLWSPSNEIFKISQHYEGEEEEDC